MLKEIEKEVKDYWEKNNIRKKVLECRKGCKKFFFMDGPPYATGFIHMGTAWNKILKDFYLRFFRMLGFDVWAQPGNDTHGLPIENKVEKLLGFKSKRDIEKFGVERFNEECKKFATRFIDVMNRQFNNLAVWMDWENPYLTLENYYIESAWYTFKKAFEKNLLYKAVYPVHVCPRCETAVAYNEVEHAKIKDPAIYVKFKIKERENEYLLIWTTTPWTLPANVAVMVNPELEYAKVKVGDETLIVARELVESVMKKAGVKDYEVVEVVKGRDLEYLEYIPPFPELECQKGVRHFVVLSEQFVSADEGTGLVHCAPGHGREDFKVAREYNLPVICPVSMNGVYKEEAGFLKGKFVRDANDEIIEELKKRNLLFARETIVHDYPVCWRCKTPLLFLAVEQWFFRVSAIRKKLLEENEKVKWIPKFAKERFKNWLESLDEGPISRQRYWGIPLPIWICSKCNSIKVVGSVEELGVELKDLHRPYVDEVVIKCEKCGGEMHRVKDVLDVWFDSGVASWASLKYPKEKELFESMWPSDLQIEGPDQIRGWWNSQLITSVITFDRAPFKAIIMHGLVLDEKGVKMSKSLGNIVIPEEVAEKYCVDTLRFSLLKTDPANDFYFSWKDVESTHRNLLILVNCFNYFKTYCRKVDKIEESKLKVEDRWIISRINSLIKRFVESCKEYQGYKAVQELEKFVVNDLSRTYIKVVRERSDEGVSYALTYVLSRLLTLLAPIAPHTAEYLYLNMFKESEESVETFEKLILQDRDKIMAENIINILKNDNTIINGLVIVGKDHIEGILKELKNLAKHQNYTIKILNCK